VTSPKTFRCPRCRTEVTLVGGRYLPRHKNSKGAYCSLAHEPGAPKLGASSPSSSAGNQRPAKKIEATPPEAVSRPRRKSVVCNRCGELGRVSYVRSQVRMALIVTAAR
jgi:adenine-specific DNA methylase